MAEQKPEDSTVVDARQHPAAVVAVPGMFYYLGPVAVIVLVALMALWLLNTRDEAQDRAVPTTGIEQEAPDTRDTPGGGSADPQHESPADEREYRGGDQR